VLLKCRGNENKSLRDDFTVRLSRIHLLYWQKRVDDGSQGRFRIPLQYIYISELCTCFQSQYIIWDFVNATINVWSLAHCWFNLKCKHFTSKRRQVNFWSYMRSLLWASFSFYTWNRDILYSIQRKHTPRRNITFVKQYSWTLLCT